MSFHVTYRGWTISFAKWAGGYYAVREGSDEIETGGGTKSLAYLVQFIDRQVDNTIYLGDLLEGYSSGSSSTKE